MLPLLLAALPAEIDATASVSPTASAVYATTGTTHFAMALAAADASLWTRIRLPRTTFLFDMSGHYGQALFVTGTNNPPRDVSTHSRARADIVSSPRTTLVFLSDGFVSSRIGLRASDELLVRDPFSANRVLDGWSAQSSLSIGLAPRASLRFDARYSQMGAVAADLPAAVGIDTHSLLLSATASFQASRRLSVGPVARLGWTHFNHALLDVEMHRGTAEVTSFSALASARYDLSGRTRASVMAGVTLASAPPQVKDVAMIASPVARFEVRTLGRRVGGTAAVSMGYEAVGPRIGFGMDYSGVVDAWAMPFRGGNRRGVLVHLVARTRWASALLALSTPTPGASTQSNTGKLETTAFALGTSISAPFRLGWSLTGGIDLEFVSMHIDPLPERGDPPAAFRGLLTLGLTAASSTDRRRLLPRDPLMPQDDPRTAAPIRAVRRSASKATVEDQDDDDDESEENDD